MQLHKKTPKSMNTAELYQLLQTKVNHFNETFQSLESNPLSEDRLESLQKELAEVNDTLVVLKFMVGISGDAAFQIERENAADASPKADDSEEEVTTDIMHEVDAFESAIAEDAETEEQEILTDTKEDAVIEEVNKVEEAEATADINDDLEIESEEDAKVDTEVLSKPEVDAAKNADNVETNERFNQDDNSLADRLKKSPVTDLKAAIGLNQRFLFSNELFNGNMEAFNRAVNELNHLESLNDARRFLEIQLVPKYEWNTDSEVVVEFTELIERRFM